jgi:hypothetical protein
MRRCVEGYWEHNVPISGATQDERVCRKNKLTKCEWLEKKREKTDDENMEGAWEETFDDNFKGDRR